VQGGDVPVRVGPADYLHVRTEAPEVLGEIDVGRVVVGGDEGGGGLFDPGPLQGADIGGVAGDVAGVVLRAPGVLFHDEVIHLPLLEPLGDRLSHPSAADDDHRVAGVAGQLVESVHLVITGDLLFRAGEDQGSGAIDRGLRGRRHESAPFPYGDDRYPDLFPKAAFRQGFTHQRGADRGGFGDDEVVETPQDIGAKIAAEGPARQGTTEDLRQFQDPGASRQIEDIDGVG